MSRLAPVIDELARLNAPVMLRITSVDLFKETADVYWIGHGDELLVGSIEAVGYTSTSPSQFKLRTDRISFNAKGSAKPDRCVKYKHAVSCAAGLMRHAVPLHPEEQRMMDVNGLKKAHEAAEAAMYDPTGRCCCLITTHARDVIDFLLYGRKSKALQKVVDELRVAEANCALARQQYERSLHEPLPKKVH